MRFAFTQPLEHREGCDVSLYRVPFLGDVPAGPVPAETFRRITDTGDVRTPDGIDTRIHDIP